MRVPHNRPLADGRHQAHCPKLLLPSRPGSNPFVQQRQAGPAQVLVPTPPDQAPVLLGSASAGLPAPAPHRPQASSQHQVNITPLRPS